MLRSTATRFVCLRAASHYSTAVKPITNRLNSHLQSITFCSPHVFRRGIHSDLPPSTQKQCPSCSSPLPTPLPICPKCKHIEPVSPEMSYHEMFGFDYEPNPFNIDTSALRQMFRKAITVAHPDKWAGSDEGQQRLIQSLSTTLNNANRTLADPLQRVLYILERQGVPAQGEDTLDDPVLLYDVMELREEIENAESQEDIDEIRTENNDNMKYVVHEIYNLVEAKDWPAVKNAAIKLKYMRGIEDAAKAWPNSHFDH